MKVEKDNDATNAKLEKLEKQLLKAKILIKMQRKMLKNFMLHDDAGTAYIYLGPNPEDLENLCEAKAELDEVSDIQKYDHILNILYEIEILLEKQDVAKELVGALELLQDKFMDLYIAEREKANED